MRSLQPSASEELLRSNYFTVCVVHMMQAAMADEPGSGEAVAAKRGTERKRAGEVGRMAFAAGNSHTARHAGERIDPRPA